MESLLKEIILKLDTMQEDVTGLKKDISILKDDVTVLKEDVTVLKEDVAGLKRDVTVLKEDITGLKEDVVEIKEDLKAVFNQTADLTEFRTETKEQLEVIRVNQEVFIKEIHNTKVEIERLKKKAV